MAHGRHRRATIRKIQLPFLMETPAPALQPAPRFLCMDCGGNGGEGTMDPDEWFPCETCKGTGGVSDPLLVDQQHIMHDGDDTERVFNLMACVHPATCTCETDYPNWAPGLR